MKFPFAPLAVVMGLVAHALANPTPQIDSQVTYHCGGGTAPQTTAAVDLSLWVLEELASRARQGFAHFERGA
ncbi:hypothetical protein D9619_006624 [Psilocybe cf. subviscida]|uniref:Uncharacterized protein n=1 Tax=Psilocybe cf. subviscida TaxID=2480587 RepID=A0A8H5B3N4_9AGAR|nr:hypothetical protein D9619_006624 [Psilocybe cf. subviscida]